MHFSIVTRRWLVLFVLTAATASTQTASAQLPNSPCGYCHWIELINDPLADGIVTEDGVTGYQYVYDVWIGAGGTDNWEASYALGGTNGPLGVAGSFDGTQAARYRESQLTDEQYGDTSFKGVWSAWYNSSAGTNSQAPEGAYVPSSFNAPSALWNETTLEWDIPVLDVGDALYQGGTATTGRFADVGLGNPLPWSLDNPYHTGDDYRYSSEYRMPGISWSQDIPVDEGLVWGKLGGIWTGYEDGLEATIRIVHPNSPGSINYSFVNYAGSLGPQIVTGPSGAPYAPPVPEPATVVMGLMALAGLASLVQRRRRA